MICEPVQSTQKNDLLMNQTWLCFLRWVISSLQNNKELHFFLKYTAVKGNVKYYALEYFLNLNTFKINFKFTEVYFITVHHC